MQSKFAKLVRFLDAFKSSITKYDDVDEENYTAAYEAIEAINGAIEYDLEELERELEGIPCETDEDFHDRDEIQKRVKSLVRAAKERLIDLGVDPDEQEKDKSEED